MSQNINERVRRATIARAPVVFVTTSAEQVVVESLKNELSPKGYVITRFNPVFGMRPPILSSETVSVDVDDMGKPIPWDSGFINEPFAALSNWMDALENNPDGPLVNKVTKQIVAQGSDIDVKNIALRSQHVQLQKTLLCQGLATWLDKNNGHHLVQRMVWEIGCWNKSHADNLIIVLPAHIELPDELVDIGIILDDPLPNRDTIRTKIWPAFHENKAGKQRYASVLFDPDGTLGDRAADSLTGLTSNRIRTSLMVGLEEAYQEGAGTDGFLHGLVEQKREVLKQSAALELMKPEDIKNVGGLNGLKQWLLNQAKSLSPEAKALGITPPRGALLLGPPGAGKSMCAKAAASVFNFPLIKFDLAACYGGLVGQSEAQIRTALSTLDALAPAVVLMDEVEKGFAGHGGGNLDGGTSTRVLGTILSWMNDRDPTNPLILMMSANNISSLPPELLRKGRVDEIFFVDLPNTIERAAILDIHLRIAAAKATAPGHWALTEDEHDIIVAKTNDWVGAEIAQLIIEAKVNSFAEGKSFFDAMLEVLGRTVPLSVTRAEQIQEIRTWASTRCRMATDNTIGEKSSTSAGVSFNLDQLDME